MTTYAIVTSNIITTTSHAITTTADEDLQIAAGVLVVANNNNTGSTYDGIYLGPSTAGGEVDVAGYVGGYDGINYAYSVGDETISVGETGSVVGARYGVYMLVGFATPAAEIVRNAGDISGGLAGVYTSNEGNEVQIENSGVISGATGVVLASSQSDVLINDAGGLITGVQAISAAGTSESIVNAGRISATGLNGAIEFQAGDSIVTNSGEIDATIGTLNFVGVDGNNAVYNSGVISATTQQAIYFGGGGNYLDNSGQISSGYDTIQFAGAVGQPDWVVNETGGVISVQSSSADVIADPNGKLHVVNHGDIDGLILANADDSAFMNTGDYNGSLQYGGGGNIVRNAGKMTFDGSSQILAGPPTTQLQGEGIYIGGASGFDDRLVNTADAVIDATGAISLYHGTAGSFRFINHGDIYGDIDLYGLTTGVNASLLSGDVNFYAASSLFVNRGIVTGNVSFTGTGNIYRGLSGEVTGTIYGVGADGRYLGGAADDTFDMTASGAKYVSGGAGDDAFLFTAAGLTSNTVLLGGAGTDTLTFTTAGIIAPTAFARVSGIEVVNLASGNNNLVLNNAFVGSATDDSIAVNGNSLVDTINASAVTAAGDTVTMYGGLGADVLTAGGGTDIFAYHAVNESTGPYCDTVVGANLSVDKFDVSAVAKSILAINAAVTTGSLSTASFNADLVNDLPAAKLGAHDALLFTANAGTLSGQTYLVIDVNGTAGYQANADLVIHLTAATGTLTTASFM